MLLLYGNAAALRFCAEGYAKEIFAISAVLRGISSVPESSSANYTLYSLIISNGYSPLAFKASALLAFSTRLKS